MPYFRPSVAALAAYRPGEQPAAGQRVVKLNTNENPYPPGARALAALQAVGPDDLRLYPRPLADEFRASAAAVLGVDPEWIVVGNGSDDLLTMLFRSVTAAGRPVAFPVPTYVLYRTLAQIQDAPAVEVPFDDAYRLPVERLAAAGAALTIVASPNSPSGNRMPNADLQDLAGRTPGLLAIDEAYAAFAAGDALELTRRCENVIVLRTLSKSHSLAGLRLGFAVAPPPLLAGLIKVKDSYNVDAVAAASAQPRCATPNTSAPTSSACAPRAAGWRGRWPASGAASGPARLTSCWCARRAATPAPCTRRSRRAASWCATSTSRCWPTGCASRSARRTRTRGWSMRCGRCWSGAPGARPVARGPDGGRPVS